MSERESNNTVDMDAVSEPAEDDFDRVEDFEDYDFVDAPAGKQEAVYEAGNGEGRFRLPSALLTQFAKQLIGAGIAFIITITLLIYFHTPQCLVGFVLVGYLLYCAWALRRDYEKGKIEEVSVVCSSVSSMGTKNACRVVFRSVMTSETDTPVYYEFYVPGKLNSNSSFVPTCIYIIYFRPTDPRKLLGYFQV